MKFRIIPAIIAALLTLPANAQIPGACCDAAPPGWLHVGIEYWGTGNRDFPFTVGDGRTIYLDSVDIAVAGSLLNGDPRTGGFAQSLVALYSPLISAPGHTNRPTSTSENFEVDSGLGSVNIKIPGGQANAHVMHTFHYNGIPLPNGALHINIDTATAAVPIDTEVHLTIHYHY